ncbi:unnamed protein product, partial [Symbiodinium sp. CCMP2456]
MEALRRRIAVLKSFQSRLLWPPVTHFQAFGQSIALPYRRTERGGTVLPKNLLSYLAGFFDGDGCVSSCAGVCTLMIGQATPRQEVLYLYANTFGGTVYVHNRGIGLRQPSLQWVITGHAAQIAASQLAPECVVKHLQLRVAASWPAEKSLRLDAQHRLAALNRQSQPAVAHHGCSWAYIAGFFDAEGCISCLPQPNMLRLSVTQKSKPVLCWIDSFWYADLGLRSSWSVRRSNAVTEVSVSRQSDTRLLMRRLLDNGLFLKKPQALLGLSLEESNYADVRDRMARLSGNQGRYQTLSQEGSNEAAPLLERLQGMQQEHERLNALHVYRSLRSDIRSLLAKGASVTKGRVVAIFVASPEEADETEANKTGPLEGASPTGSPSSSMGLAGAQSPQSASWSVCGVACLMAYRLYTGFNTATWLPYLLAREGEDLWYEDQAAFMGLAKLIYG